MTPPECSSQVEHQMTKESRSILNLSGDFQKVRVLTEERELVQLKSLLDEFGVWLRNLRLRAMNISVGFTNEKIWMEQGTM